MRVSTVFLLAVLLALALAVSARLPSRHARLGKVADLLNPRVTLYNRAAAPQGWSVVQQADPSTAVSFHLIVDGSNADLLEKKFWEVSDPDHPSYGQFMSNAEIEQLVAPSASDLDLLFSTLAQHGIDHAAVTSHGDSFEVTTTVQAASSLFATTFFTFSHGKSGMTAVRQMGEYSLPSALAKQVRMVLGVHTFPTIEQRLRMSAERKALRASIAAHVSSSPSSNPTAPPNAVDCWVPKAVAGVYQVPYPIKPLSTPWVQAGVIEWSQQTFSPRDLALFSANVSVPLAPVDAHHIVGNNTEVPYPGLEAELDIQWIEGMNPAFTPWFWLVSDPQQWMWSWTLQFLVATEYPSVVSLSYGLPEIDQCRFFNPSDCNGVDYAAYIHLVDKQFMKIGLVGVSVITATQDRGVYASDPTSSSPNAPARFTPEYPGSSSYVTSVGATEYINPVFNLTNAPHACNTSSWSCISGGSDEESVSAGVSGFLSSGGFSDVDVTPDYQQAAVQGYFKSNVTLPDQSLWNRTGRGSPDVSAIGMNGYVIQQGRAELVSGASMSTPIFAAIMALVQADYQYMTNSTLGFLNPMLYKGQASGAMLFKDIVMGDNCSTQKCRGTQDGFSATQGWDPVSGLGSPLYPGLKAYLTQLAQKVLARRAAAAAAAGL